MTQKKKKGANSKISKFPEKEIFEIEKDGKTEVIEKEVKETEEKEEKAGQVKEEKNTLRNILVVVGTIIFLLVLFGAYLYLSHKPTTFTYEGVKFQIVKEGSLLLYNTKIPLYNQTVHYADYNFYLRKDPRYLNKKIEFIGNLTLYKNTFINLTEEFNCAGDGVIGLANLLNQYKIMGMNLTRHENISCDSLGRYAQIQIIKANKTSIKEESENCYTIYVEECKILDALERWMIEVFSTYENMPTTAYVQPRISVGNQSKS